jgi:hypothetical protein
MRKQNIQKTRHLAGFLNVYLVVFRSIVASAIFRTIFGRTPVIRAVITLIAVVRAVIRTVIALIARFV